MKTGVSTSTIIKTRGKNHYAIMKKKDDEKNERAKICLKCEFNKEGYCSKYEEWCDRSNWQCLGIKNPYEYKIPTSKKHIKSKKKIKSKKNLLPHGEDKLR